MAAGAAAATRARRTFDGGDVGGDARGSTTTKADARILPLPNTRTTQETSLPPPLLGILRGVPPSRQGGKEAEAEEEEEEEAPLAPPAPPLDASLPHNWLCRCRCRCADVVAVDAQESSLSSRLQLSPSAVVALVTCRRAGVVVIVVIVVKVNIDVRRHRPRRCIPSRHRHCRHLRHPSRCHAVAIVIDFVAHRAIAIVIDVVVRRAFAIIVNAVTHHSVSIFVVSPDAPSPSSSTTARRLRISDSKETIAMRAATPSRQQGRPLRCQNCHRRRCSRSCHHRRQWQDACASVTATMPSRQGQQCHCDDGEVRCVVKIFFIVVSRHAVAIIVDNGKTPAHR